MIYLSIDNKSAESKRFIETLRKRKDVTIHMHPNEETKQALRDAKAGKGEVIKDVKLWFKKILE